MNDACPYVETADEGTSYCRLGIPPGHVVVTRERLTQLEDSYRKILQKYYEADAALARVRAAMRRVLEARAVTDESSTELYDS